MNKNYLQLMTKLVFLLIFCVSLLSCGKDETFNPKQKIKRIYEGAYGGPKYLKQEWTWDNDRLMKIDFYSSDDEDIILRNREYFTYEDNKLIKVENNDAYFQISYKNKKYDRIELYRKNGYLLATWDFSYRNNKVSKIILTDNDDYWDSKMENEGFLSFLMPVSIMEYSSKMGGKKSSSAFVTTITYQYSGNNITEIKWTLNEPDDYIIYTYNSYDDMLNPFYKHIELESRYIEKVTSENNPKKAHMSISSAPKYESDTDYLYQYNNDMFPIEVVVRTFTEDFFDSYIDLYKRYYEYE